MVAPEQSNIAVHLDELLARQQMSLAELARQVGITEQNLHKLKREGPTGATSIRFNTLAAICRVLNCQPGDLLSYEPADDTEAIPIP